MGMIIYPCPNTNQMILIKTTVEKMQALLQPIFWYSSINEICLDSNLAKTRS